MPRVGQARRRDLNEPDIVEALQAAGAQVTRISGEGAPDLLVRFRGLVWAFEVKSNIGRQTKAQSKTDWPIVRTIDEAMQAIGVTK